MAREAVLDRLATLGLTERVAPLAPSAGELLVTWLTPLLREYETVDQLARAGAESIEHKPSEATTARLKAKRDFLGERVFVLWPFEATAVEMALDDFAEHVDDLWLPSADDVWLLSLLHTRFVALHHEELFLAVELDGPTRWPVWR